MLKRVALVLAMIASPAMADPVYLECVHSDEPQQVTLDEAAGEMSVSTNNGATKMTASYTPNEVIGHTAFAIRSFVANEDWRINRVQSTYAMSITLHDPEGLVADKVAIQEEGTCKVVPTPKRQF